MKNNIRGISDDLPAICDAHDHANRHGLRIRSRPDAIYHLGRRALTAVIATDTDWGTSRFTIDDSEGVENHLPPLFGNPNTTRANEVIGYIVIESVSRLSEGVAYEAGLGADPVRGPDDSAAPSPYTLGGALGSASSVAASITGMDDGSGSWAVLAGNPAFSATGIGLYACEDQIFDAERCHATEQVGFIVFE